MSMSKSERLAAASEEFKEKLVNDEEFVKDSRYISLKLKKSETGTGVNNSIIIKDQSSQLKYVVSVSASMTGENPVVDELLLKIQAKVAKFLQTIHEDI